MPNYTPADCPHCEYDRRFPGFEAGGWLQQDNNGPIVPCPVCNDEGGLKPLEPEFQAAIFENVEELYEP